MGGRAIFRADDGSEQDIEPGEICACGEISDDRITHGRRSCTPRQVIDLDRASIASHHRQCARCSGHIDVASGWYEVHKHPPLGERRQGKPAGPGFLPEGSVINWPATMQILYFDGLDCLAAYASAQDEAFPVRDRKQLVCPHQVSLCDWCWDYHFEPDKFGPLYGTCGHSECQCWCVT